MSWKKKIPLEKTEETFRQNIEKISQPGKMITVDEALLVTRNFYNEYEIEGVDDTVPDYDMLLFQYGIYDWENTGKADFTIDFTRQFYIDDPDTDEFYQLRTTLHFEPADFGNIDGFSKWSTIYPGIDEWATAIQATEGYQKARSHKIKHVDIQLSLT